MPWLMLAIWIALLSGIFAIHEEWSTFCLILASSACPLGMRAIDRFERRDNMAVRYLREICYARLLCSAILLAFMVLIALDFFRKNDYVGGRVACYAAVGWAIFVIIECITVFKAIRQRDEEERLDHFKRN